MPPDERVDVEIANQITSDADNERQDKSSSNENYSP